jgi:hypothetical protein
VSNKPDTPMEQSIGELVAQVTKLTSYLEKVVSRFEQMENRVRRPLYFMWKTSYDRELCCHIPSEVWRDTMGNIRVSPLTICGRNMPGTQYADTLPRGNKLCKSCAARWEALTGEMLREVV